MRKDFTKKRVTVTIFLRKMVTVTFFCILFAIDSRAQTVGSLQLLGNTFVETSSENNTFAPGASFNLASTVGAVGQNVSTVYATLSSTDSCITIQQDSAFLGTIALGSPVTNSSSPFQFSISSACLSGHSVNFTLTLAGTNSTQTSTITINVSSAPSTTIAWSKAWTSANTGQFGTYTNGYEDIQYDPYSKKTWFYTTDTTNAGQGIYSSRLHYFDSTTKIDTTVGDNGQTDGSGCIASTTTWPYSHHAVGQFFIDQVRHRAISFQGTSCADIGPEQWYYQLSNPPDNHNTWNQTQPLHMPMYTYTTGTNDTTLTGGNGGVGTGLGLSDTTMYLAAPTAFDNGAFVKIDSEIVKIIAGGSTHGYQSASASGSPGTNPFTIVRAQYGTSAAVHNNGANAYYEEGQFNSGAIVHDTYDDAFFLYGLPQSGNHSFYVYCDTSHNPVPGTLTAKQQAVGCANPDDWTDITSKSICADSSCYDFVTGTNGANSGYGPPGFYYPNMAYDNVHHNVMTWASSRGYGSSGTFLPTGQYGVYVYNPTTFTWTKQVTSCIGADCVVGQNSPQPQSANSEGWRIAHAFNALDGKYYYHLSLRTSAVPTVTQTQDWAYDPSTTTWTELGAGQGPNYTETMTFDSTCNCLIDWGITSPSQALAEIWMGQLSTSGSPLSSPTTPANLTATAISTSQINLSWTASTDSAGVTGYKIYRGGSQIATSTTTAYSDTGLAASTNYSYTVSAYDALGNASAQSASANATTLAGAATTPTVSLFMASTPTITAGQSTTLSWMVTGTPAPTISINNGVGTVIFSSVSVSPTVTTTYTLMATNSAGSVTQTVTVTVNPVSTPVNTPVNNPPSTAPAVFVQGSCNAVSATSLSIPFNSPNTAGNTIIVSAQWNTTSMSNVTISDSQGNTYASTPQFNGTRANRIWYASNIKAGANTVTITLSSADTVRFFIHEYSGLSASNALDVFATGTGSTTAAQTNSAVTTQAGDLIFGSWWAGGSITAGSGFTTRESCSGNLTEDQMASSAGSYSAVAVGHGGAWDGFMAAFKPAATGPDTTPPSVPTGLTATAESASQINLTWSASRDDIGAVAGYKIYRGGVFVATNATTSYSDTGLTAATAYNYTVTAYDASANNSAPSSPFSVTTLSAAAAPPVITSFTASPASITVGQTTTLSWVLTGTPTPTVSINNNVGVVTGTSVSDVSPAATTTYTLTATNSAGSATQTVTVTVNAPVTISAPLGLTVLAASSTQVNLSWMPSTDNLAVVSYKIYRGGVQVGTSPTESYSDTGLNPTTSYSYTVSAFDASGNISTQSGSINATTPATGAAAFSALGNPSVNGLGASTLNCVDPLGKGYGVGPGCIGPDADWTDPVNHTATQVIAKWGSMTAFLAHKGYNPKHIFYLSPTGNDNTGVMDDPTHPYQTWQAINILQSHGGFVAGDMVMFRAGTYVVGSGIYPINGTAGNPVILMAYPGETVWLDNSSNQQNVLYLVDRSYVIVDGLKFTGSLGSSGCISGGTYDTNTSSTYHDLAFRNLEITHCTQGMIMQNGMYNITIENNLIHNIHDPVADAQHCIYLGSRALPSHDIVVQKNICYDTSWNGLHLNGQINNIQVQQNIFYNNGVSGINIQNGTSNSFFRENLVLDADTNGIGISDYPGDCAQFGQGGTGTICPYNQTGNLFENNIIYQSGLDHTGAFNPRPAFYIENYAVNQVGDLGHQTFRNNIFIGYGNYGTGGSYPPIVFGDGNQNYLATSTFTNNILWSLDGATDRNVIGFGAGPGYGFQGYTCAQLATMTTISGCMNVDPKFVNVSPSNYSSPSTFNFALSVSSPGIGAGIGPTTLTYDLGGNATANPPSLGIFELPSGSSMSGLVLGNPSGSGAVTIFDAALIAQYAVGLIPLTTAQMHAGEVSSTETTPTIYDAYLIAQYAVGLITRFPVQP